MNAVFFGIVAYILLQLAIGLLVSRGIKNESDYLLAGRSLGLLLGSFSIFATWFGAETCIGAAGAIYSDGLAGASSDPFGYGICLIMMGLCFAVPLWRRGFTTFADLFRDRYSPNIERLVVLLLIPTSVLWAAAQIRAFGQILTVSSGFELNLAIAIATAVVIIYTVFGGLLADVYTDLLQGVILIVGLITLSVVIIDSAGGFSSIASTIAPERLRLFTGQDASALSILETWAIPIFGSVLSQEVIARVLAMRSPQTARRASLLGGGMYIALGMIPLFLGLVGITLIPGLEDPEQLLPMLAQQHFTTFFYIVFAGALLSAILSTVDSALLAAAALLEHNIIVPLKPGISETAKVRIARICVVAFGVVACLIALSGGSVYDLVKEASGFGSAGVFVVAVFALFTNIGSRIAAASTLITGLLSWILGAYIFEIEIPYLVSLAVSLSTYATVSIIEKNIISRWKPIQTG